VSKRAAGEVTNLLRRWQEPNARGELFSIVYPELRRIATKRMEHESDGHLLQPTALVHELFLQMAKQDEMISRDRAHFLAIASLAMRRLLVEYARSQGALRNGGAVNWLPLDGVDPGFAPDIEQTLQLEEILERLNVQFPRAAQVVELRCFGGLTFDEAAEAMGVDQRTAKRDWEFAVAWLNSSYA